MFIALQIVNMVRFIMWQLFCVGTTVLCWDVNYVLTSMAHFLIIQGQYIKWVSPNGPADLAGMLPGDHVLEVDGTHVETESHQTVANSC